MARELIKERQYMVGYVVRTERLSGTEYGVSEGESFEMKSAFTPDGKYIGSPDDARSLVAKRGIRPEYIDPASSVCSVGFCESDQKWYGWSHRAICGFGIGDKLFEEYFEGSDDNTPFVAHGSKTIETLSEARQAACNFANSVS